MKKKRGYIRNSVFQILCCVLVFSSLAFGQKVVGQHLFEYPKGNFHDDVCYFDGVQTDCTRNRDDGTVTFDAVPDDLGAPTSLVVGDRNYACADVGGSLRCWGKAILSNDVLPKFKKAKLATGSGDGFCLFADSRIECFNRNFKKMEFSPEIGEVDQLVSAHYWYDARRSERKGVYCARSGQSVNCWNHKFEMLPRGSGYDSAVDLVLEENSGNNLSICIVTRLGGVRCSDPRTGNPDWYSESLGRDTLKLDLSKDGIFIKQLVKNDSNESAMSYRKCAYYSDGHIRCIGSFDELYAISTPDLVSVIGEHFTDSRGKLWEYKMDYPLGIKEVELPVNNWSEPRLIPIGSGDDKVCVAWNEGTQCLSRGSKYSYKYVWREISPSRVIKRFLVSYDGETEGCWLFETKISDCYGKKFQVPEVFSSGVKGLAKKTDDEYDTKEPGGALKDFAMCHNGLGLVFSHGKTRLFQNAYHPECTLFTNLSASQHLGDFNNSFKKISAQLKNPQYFNISARKPAASYDSREYCVYDEPTFLCFDETGKEISRYILPNLAGWFSLSVPGMPNVSKEKVRIWCLDLGLDLNCKYYDFDSGKELSEKDVELLPFNLGGITFADKVLSLFAEKKEQLYLVGRLYGEMAEDQWKPVFKGIPLKDRMFSCRDFVEVLHLFSKVAMSVDREFSRALENELRLLRYKNASLFGTIIHYTTNWIKTVAQQQDYWNSILGLAERVQELVPAEHSTELKDEASLGHTLNVVLASINASGGKLVSIADQKEIIELRKELLWIKTSAQSLDAKKDEVKKTVNKHSSFLDRLTQNPLIGSQVKVGVSLLEHFGLN